MPSARTLSGGAAGGIDQGQGQYGTYMHVPWKYPTVPWKESVYVAKGVVSVEVR